MAKKTLLGLMNLRPLMFKKKNNSSKKERLKYTSPLL